MPSIVSGIRVAQKELLRMDRSLLGREGGVFCLSLNWRTSLGKFKEKNYVVLGFSS